MTCFIANPCTGKVHAADCGYAAASFEVVPYADLYDALANGYVEAGCCLTDKCIATAQRSRAIVQSGLYEGVKKQCCICGHSRRVERAHLVPRHAGGGRTAPLCPNCHQAFDFGQLSEHEMRGLIGYCKKHLGMTARDVHHCHGWGRLIA